MNDGKPDSLAIKITGPAGAGVMQVGELLSEALNSVGFFTLVYPEYPSRIRGGDNNIQIVISSKPNLSPRKKVEAVFALDKGLLALHKNELAPGGRGFDADSIGISKLPEVLANPIVKNTALAGFIWKFLSQDIEVLTAQIKKIFGKKFVALNIKAARAGFSLQERPARYELKGTKNKIFSATGNEVFASAAVEADVEYASIYPMTPITSIIAHLTESRVKMTIPEDEIFAALSTVGASYAGKRALTATSGGGFCLMTEAIGLSGMAEIPFVVILGQRTGPSSGFPTYTSQADLNFAINSSHGEFPKIVLAPGDLKEIAELTQIAFNLADKYQIPVIILTDKFLSESRFSTDRQIDKIKIRIDKGKRYTPSSKIYNRYQLTRDGISPRAYPGETTFLTNSYEHDEYGFSTDSAKMRERMTAKRMAKLGNLTGGFEVYGAKKAEIIIVGWGSTKTELVDIADDFPKLKFIHVFRPWPFPEEIKSEIAKARKVIAIENNFSGQMAKIIENETGVETKKILKDNGRPFFREELIKAIKSKI